MSALLWASWGADWTLNDKVSFDGVNKIIYVHPEVTNFDIRRDLYTSWVDWIALYDHTKFLPAVRVTGLDPIGGGIYTGDTYFLINGWKLSINLQTAKVTGVLFSDDYDTAYYTPSLQPQYPATVSSLVTTVSTGGGSGGASPAEIWSYNNRSLTTPFPTVPTAVQIRTEIDSNSTKLQSISDQHTTILDAIGNISVASSAINSPAIGFQIVSGIVTTGTFSNTRSLDGSMHTIRDQALNFDVNYSFDIGLNAVPSQLVFVGMVQDKQEIVEVDMWNYVSSAWETIGTISGSTAAVTVPFTLYSDHVGTVAGQIGDVKVRFHSTAVSDVILNVDHLYVSYSEVQKQDGYSGHIISATATSVVLGADAAGIDNYYFPSLLYVNHGTGARQYAKVISYTGSTKTLQFELPMAVVLDTTSHITLSPWASADIPATQMATLTTGQTGSLTPTQETMLLEMYNILGLDATKPLLVTANSRTAGSISQTIVTDSNSTLVTRN